MIIDLDTSETWLAAQVGAWRQLRVLRDGLGRGHGEAGRESWDRHITGAIAELAVAKMLGVFWSGKAQDFGRNGDVEQFEIRSTIHERGCLIVYPEDPDSRVMLLVIVRRQSYRIAGSIVASHAKRPEFAPPQAKLRPGSPPQFWVPQNRLTPFAPSIVGRRRDVDSSAEIPRRANAVDVS